MLDVTVMLTVYGARTEIERKTDLKSSQGKIPVSCRFYYDLGMVGVVDGRRVLFPVEPTAD